MRKKRKTCRKATHRLMSDLPSNNKENSFSSVFCSKGEIQDFRTKVSEPVTRGSHFETASVINGTSKSGASQEKICGSKQPKRSRRRRNNKSPHLEWYECNGNLTFPTSKCSSIAFFIPLNSQYANNVEETIKWNDFYFYESNTTAMISRYRAEKKKKKLLRDRNFVPESKPKYRSSSESSANSDDSVIFANDDNLFDDEDCTGDTMNSFIEYDQDGTDEPNCASSCSGANSSQRRSKKVRFVDNSELVTVHVIVAWNYAYRAARISPWEVVARDSNRFKSKIQSLEPIISRVLRPEHRQKIWETRMSNYESC